MVRDDNWNGVNSSCLSTATFETTGTYYLEWFANIPISMKNNINEFSVLICIVRV